MKATKAFVHVCFVCITVESSTSVTNKAICFSVCSISDWCITCFLAVLIVVAHSFYFGLVTAIIFSLHSGKQITFCKN